MPVSPLSPKTTNDPLSQPPLEEALPRNLGQPLLEVPALVQERHDEHMGVSHAVQKSVPRHEEFTEIVRHRIRGVASPGGQIRKRFGGRQNLLQEFSRRARAILGKVSERQVDVMPG